MAHYQTIDLPSSMLTQQANARVEFLIEQYNSQNIQSPTDLLQISASVFQDFFETLGQPLLTSLIFSGLPIAQDWNVYQRRATTDISILYAQTLELSKRVDLAINFSSIENEMLISAANTLKNQISSFQASKPVGFGLRKVSIGDDFYDHSKVDSKNTNALITTGTVELFRTSSSDYSDLATVTVDDEYVTAILEQDQIQQISSPSNTLGPSGLSNGFVGTTHEVLVNENTNTASASSSVGTVQLNANPGDTISFVGDYGLHADVNAVLDNNHNTWFEYEVCNIPDVFKQSPANNYGFTFTLGRADGTTTEIPWYAFHDQSQASAQSSATTPAPLPEIFPPPPTTSKPGPFKELLTPYSIDYSQTPNTSTDPNTGQSTLTPASSGSNIVFNESGAPRVGGLLKLALNIDVGSDKLMAQVTILPNVFAGKRPVVASVQVKSSAESDWTFATPIKSSLDTQKFIDISGKLPSLTSISTDDALETWVFPPRLVKDIRIIMEQPQSYDTNIGHIVWATQQTGVNVLSTDPPQIYNALFAGKPHDDATFVSSNLAAVRTEGPKISLENLVSASNDINSGTDTSNSTGVMGAVLGLVAGIGSFLSGSSGATGDSSVPNANKLSGPYIEYFRGWRYAIGIRDISFGVYTYSPSSTFTSKDFTVPVDIKKVSLQVHEEIPNSTDLPEYDSQTDWIAYSISLDGGATWTPIAPSSHFFSSDPKVYMVNPPSGTISVSSKQGAIETNNYSSSSPVNKIRIRANIKRPQSVNTLSPRLHRYQLILEGNPI